MPESRDVLVGNAIGRGFCRPLSEGSKPTPDHHFTVGAQVGRVSVCLYEDGLPSEIFIDLGNTVSSGAMKSFAIAISTAFQYGVPVEVLAELFIDTSSTPWSHTNNPKVPEAKSVVDYIFRWLVSLLSSLPQLSPFVCPSCDVCGSITVFNGSTDNTSCFRCLNCGNNMTRLIGII